MRHPKLSDALRIAYRVWRAIRKTDLRFVQAIIAVGKHYDIDPYFVEDRILVEMVGTWDEDMRNRTFTEGDTYPHTDLVITSADYLPLTNDVTMKTFHVGTLYVTTFVGTPIIAHSIEDLRREAIESLDFMVDRYLVQKKGNPSEDLMEILDHIKTFVDPSKRPDENHWEDPDDTSLEESQ